jgi:DNA-binding response OmpR family regulator
MPEALLFDSKTRLLLASCDLAHACLIQEALTELGENFRGSTPPRAYELTLVDVLEDALELLRAPAGAACAEVPNSPYEALLLDPKLPDVAGLSCLTRLRAAAPDLPLIVLVPRSEEELGIAFVREGAQDYLLKEEVDCGPLERSLRFATERARLARLIRESTILDPRTGCHSPAGFRILAEHDWRLAARLRLPLALHLVRAREPTEERLQALVAALGRCVSRADVVARLDADTLVALEIAGGGVELMGLGGLAAAAIELCRFDQGEFRRLEEMLESARRKVCENGRFGQHGPAAAFHATP